MYLIVSAADKRKDWNRDKKLLESLEIFRKDLGNFTRTYAFSRRSSTTATLN